LEHTYTPSRTHITLAFMTPSLLRGFWELVYSLVPPGTGQILVPGSFPAHSLGHLYGIYCPPVYTILILVFWMLSLPHSCSQESQLRCFWFLQALPWVKIGLLWIPCILMLHSLGYLLLLGHNFYLSRWLFMGQIVVRSQNGIF
jgi:H+/gluconate symporter-like permease